MKVYRLERNGWGVFGNRSGCKTSYPSDSLYGSFGFSCDRQYQYQCDWRSACGSIDGLIEYFGSDFAKLLGQGASLVEYIVPKRNVKFGKSYQWGECYEIELVFNVTKVTHRQVLIEGNDDNLYKVFSEPIKPMYNISISFDENNITYRSKVYALSS